MGLRQNALLLAAVTALIAIMADWSGAPELRRLWCLPAAILLLGLAYELWFVQRTDVSLRIVGAERGVLGRGSALSWTFTHGRSRNLALEVAPSAPPPFEYTADIQALTVPAGAARTLELTVTPRQLGTHSWPSTAVRIAGPLGLAWWNRLVEPGFAMTVVPAMFDTADHRLAASTAGRVAQRRTGSGAELLQLREYTPGDSQHAIDWKASARASRLISRDFSEDQHLEIVLAVDAGRASQLRSGSLDRLGHFANIAARFAEYAVAHDDRVGLIVFADRTLAELPPARGHSAIRRVRDVLTKIQIARAESNPLMAAIRVGAIAKQRTLVVMLTDLDDATIASQLVAAVRLLMPKHLPLIAGLASPEVESLAQRPADSWLEPYESLAAEDYSMRLQRNVATLRNLGAPALVAHPDNLERAVFDAYLDFRHRRRV
jgi:uncharacterized protein (DUF58 family)